MDIKKFKVGDIITRNKGMKYKHSDVVDGSYCGERCELLGHDKLSKIIFFKTKEFEICDLSYARDAWDEGWCRYPETLWQKIKKLTSLN